MRDFKNLWEFKMACMKRDWYLADLYPPRFRVEIFAPATGTWKQRLEEIRELLEK